MRPTLPIRSLLPNAGFQSLYSILEALSTIERPEPEVQALGLSLRWIPKSPVDGASVAVTRDGLGSRPVGNVNANGALVMQVPGSPDAVIALRNLAADPERSFRRFGFDTQGCPFCGTRLDYGTLDFGLGHCLPCGELLGWPLDQVTVERAEDELRDDITRELKEECASGEPV